MRCLKFFCVILLLAACQGDDTAMQPDNGTGQGGSSTRFAIAGDMLYVADRSTIKVFDIAGQHFTPGQEVAVGFGVETIFAKGDYLYLGASDAMYIYSIADPHAPSFVFRYTHIVACDPVVVQGNRAYITLSNGGPCNRGINELDILDISDPYHPQVLNQYPMTSPRGLAIDGHLLLVCEEDAGVKVLDVANDRNPIVLQELSGFSAYDVILHQGVATITGKDGIFQYAYTANRGDLQFLSGIPVTRTER